MTGVQTCALPISEVGDRLDASFEYNTDLFDAARIERMAGHFTRLLAAISADPVMRIGDLSMLNADERHRLLDEWNDTANDSPRDQAIHQLFEAQASKTPHATAVVYEAQSLSYEELNGKANQLAHRLRELGVGPEVLVGICVERSLDMIVGMLGILKAGGAYVPLDPAYPKERLSYMLSDAKPAVLLDRKSVV